MWFGLREAPPPPAEREAQAAARRARGATMPGGGGAPTNQPGISGLAIDQQDRIYVFNRGPKPVMVFDAAGKMLLAGADQEINGKKINPDWEHSGGVDWEGNVYVIERDAHRIVKLSPRPRQVPAAARHDAGEGQRPDPPRSAVGHRHPEERQHRRHRRLRQQPRHPLRQGRQVPQAGGEGRRRSGRQGHRPRRVGAAAQDRRRRRRRTSTSSTARTSACRSSTRT